MYGNMRQARFLYDFEILFIDLRNYQKESVYFLTPDETFDVALSGLTVFWKSNDAVVEKPVKLVSDGV